MNQVNRIASEYFSLLARAFPVMCASDEFHFLPRVQEAAGFLELMDDLSQDTVAVVVDSVRASQAQLRRQPRAKDLEEEIDRQLLLHSMAGLLIELEEVKSWRHNPLVYLKIGCIGVDHALNKPCQNAEERFGRTAERLSGLKKLIDQGSKNLISIPGPYYRVALAVVSHAQKYLDEILLASDDEGRREQLALPCAEARGALAAFGANLRKIGPTPAATVQSIPVEELVQRHFGCTRSLKEIYHIAEEEWRTGLEEIERLRRKINPNQDWQQVYESYLPGNQGEFDLFRLYGDEIARLRKLCVNLELLSGPEDQELILAETATYLRPVRSGASYSAPLTVDPRESAYFYVTVGDPSSNSPTDVLRRQRLHREFRFLSAHETYPGHHLLDTLRHNLDNPVRRQVESPLFYEGWAYYAESILAESGYVEEDLELLVDCKRRLWRAVRCLIDSGLALRRFTADAAAGLLVSVGFAAEEAVAQIERFRLNPGYQLCYSLGKYEILDLRERFLPRLGWKRFHLLLLEGGELPFVLAAQRFERLINKDESISQSSDDLKA
ncbi:MAG: DUF885 family protein [Deltaproteobacteria bacterium]